MDGFEVARRMQTVHELAQHADHDAVLGRRRRRRGAGPGARHRGPSREAGAPSDLLRAIGQLLTRCRRVATHGAARAGGGAGHAGDPPATAAARASCWPRTTRPTGILALRILERRGHTVTVAENGKEAVDALETARRRPRADGRADAGDGRVRGDRGDPRARDRRPGATSRSSR